MRDQSTISSLKMLDLMKSKNNISKLEIIKIWMNSTSKVKLTNKRLDQKVKSKLDQQIKIWVKLHRTQENFIFR